MASLLLFASVCAVLTIGYPVAFTLAGVALCAAMLGAVVGQFELVLLQALPNRIYGVLSNVTLTAVPLFVFMGTMLERSRLAESLLEDVGRLLGRRPGGLALAVIAVGALLAASTGIVGATVVTMGLLSLPVMLRHRYDPALAGGVICATGTLGQIVPPSIALVLLGDVLSSAYQEAQLQQGIFSPKTVSVGDLFAGAIVPGLLLTALYAAYVLLRVARHPELAPPLPPKADGESAGAGKALALRLAAPLLLIGAVLGSILAGAATPTEAAGIGALGATLLAWAHRQLDLDILRQCARSTMAITAMVFLILIGATIFSLVFRGFGGDEVVRAWFENLPGGHIAAMLVVMIVIFLLGFILDFIEITFLVVPIVGPILLAMDIDPVWLGIMLAVNLQTSFLTPPFGFALFYLRGVAPPAMSTSALYRGVIPFIIIQLTLLALLAIWPQLVTALPAALR